MRTAWQYSSVYNARNERLKGFMKYDITCYTYFFNYEKHVRDGVDSLLAQTGPRIEIVIFCGPSEDATLEICREYEEKYERVSVLAYDQMLTFKDRYEAFKQCQSDLIYIFDGDDRLPPDALRILFERQQETDADMVFGRVMHRDIQDRIFEPDSHKAKAAALWSDHETISLSGHKEIIPFALNTFLYSGDPIFTSFWGHVYKRDVILKAIEDYLASSSSSFQCDGTFCMYLIDNYQRVELVNKTTYHYTVMPNSNSSNYGSTFFFNDRYLDALHTYRDDIVRLLVGNLQTPKAEAVRKANMITSRQFIGFFVYNFRFKNNEDKMYKRTKELVNNPFIQELLRDHLPMQGDSRLIPLLLKLKAAWLVTMVCQRRAKLRYRQLNT